MQSFTALLPQLPIFDQPQKRRGWPVWSQSYKGPIKFGPISRAERTRIYRAAQQLDQRTDELHRHGGVIGRSALDVLRALLFDFLNCRTGRLDPSIAAIAKAARICRRTAATALKRLRELNIITWVRRSEDDYDEDGRYRLRQSTNAYATIKPSLWDGGGDLDPPDPPRDTLGFPPPIPSQLDQAAAALASGDRKELLRQLELDPHDRIATALASWAKDFPQD